jgi:hypothetical protein
LAFPGSHLAATHRIHSRNQAASFLYGLFESRLFKEGFRPGVDHSLPHARIRCSRRYQTPFHQPCLIPSWGYVSGFVDRASALGDAAFERDALPLQKTKPGDGYRMRRAQNRRSQFPQRYCLIDTNRNNLSSKSWRRDRLIRLLLQFGHVITRKRLYSLIKWVQNPILVYHLSHSRRRALSKSVLDRLFADKKADLSVSGYIKQ